MARGLALTVLPRGWGWGGGWKKVSVALFSSVSSILIQSSMDFRQSLNDAMFILEERLLVMMITGRKLIMMTV